MFCPQGGSFHALPITRNSICKEYKYQHNKTLQWTTQIYDKAEAIKSSMIGCMGDLEFDFLQRECSRRERLIKQNLEVDAHLKPLNSLLRSCYSMRTRFGRNLLTFFIGPTQWGWILWGSTFLVLTKGQHKPWPLAITFLLYCSILSIKLSAKACFSFNAVGFLSFREVVFLCR